MIFNHNIYCDTLTKGVLYGATLHHSAPTVFTEKYITRNIHTKIIYLFKNGQPVAIWSSCSLFTSQYSLLRPELIVRCIIHRMRSQTLTLPFSQTKKGRIGVAILLLISTLASGNWQLASGDWRLKRGSL